MAVTPLGRLHGTETSESLHQDALEIIPGGVSHNVRYRNPYPIYFDRAAGARMWDVDGNEYVDFWNNHSASLLGHSPPSIVESLRDQLDRGLNFGAMNEYGVRLAERVPDFVPGAQRLRYCLSGTEATMYAVRLARAYTDRDHVFKVIGGWHGANTDLSHVVHAPFDQPTTAGLPPGVENTIHGLRLDEPAEIEHALDQHDENVAAIIVDPRRSRLDGEEDIMNALDELRSEHGFQLIFDEVVTGFRMSPGSYQANVGITPDLTTLGKVLGGGMPIGAVAGRSDLFEPTRPDIDVEPDHRVLAGGGTFAMHPMSVLAGLATLDAIEDEPVHQHTESLAESARTGLRDVFEDHDVEGHVWGLSSLLYFAFEPDRPLIVPEDLKMGTNKQALLRFHDELGERGYFFNPGSGGNISYAMTPDHIEGFIEAASDSVAVLKDDGVIGTQ